MKHEVFFNTRDELTRVCLDDVMYVVADGNYVTIEMRSGRSMTLLASMQNIEQVIANEPDIHFEKVGRSHIINLTFLSQVNTLKRTITLADDIAKESVVLSVPKEAIRHLKQLLVDVPKSQVPEFSTHNGTMEAFKKDPPVK